MGAALRLVPRSQIATTPDGGRAATLALARGEGPFSVSLRDASADGLVIAEAWISRAV